MLREKETPMLTLEHEAVERGGGEVDAKTEHVVQFRKKQPQRVTQMLTYGSSSGTMRRL